MAIAFETISTTAFSETATLTLTKPTGTADGELLVAVIGAEPGGGGSVNSVPSGWTLAKQETTDGVTYMYYKIASSEGASWAWGFSASNVCGGAVLRISDPNTSDPLDQVASEKVLDDATPVFSSGDIDPTTTSSLFIMVAHVTDSAVRSTSTYAIVTNNPTWTERADFNENISGLNQSLAVATALRAEDTASGDVSFTVVSGSAGADSRLILANFNVRPNVAVTGTTGIINIQGIEGGVTAGASVTGTTGVINIVGNEGATTLSDSKITNMDKSSASTIVNKDKS